MAWWIRALLTVCLVFTPGVFGFSDLKETLTHYETLHHTDLNVRGRTRRSASAYDSPHYTEKDISFEVLDKHFHMRMHVQRGLFAKTFKAYVVGQNNEKQFYNVDRSNFLEGHLVGMKGKNRVVAHFEGKDIMATIVTEEDTYIVEPSWRHLEKSTEHSMIAYRKSDLRKAKAGDPEGHMGKSFCGFVHPDGQDEAAFNRLSQNDVFDSVVFDHNPNEKSHKRSKRQTSGTDPNHNTCTLHLVADYHFYQDIGQNTASSTANYMVGQIQKVNEIYEATTFGTMSGLGFEIKEMTMLATPTSVAAGAVHHNMQKTNWGTRDLLKAFSYDNNFGGVCLGHLFTNIAFTDGVLGLGWIASSKTGSVGGICSPSSGGYHYNTAFSTLKNKYGNRILSLESQLVTAHEFGHNWGSQHDPATDECAPSSFSGGKYTMYTYSVSGYEPNNDNFSPCSTRTIASVLTNKASSCFTARSASFCGNRQVETPYEECDAGYNANDPCCGNDCKLKSGAVCSSVNSACCTNCQPTTAGVICRDVSGLTTTCDGNATCDGTSVECPTNVYKPDGSSCVDGGQCQNGICKSVCEINNADSCICDNLAESCLTCCKSKTNSSAACVPYTDGSGSTMPLDNGKPCTIGRCNAGTCERLVVQLTDRLWSVITTITVDNIVVFMKNNIVFTTIFLSLLLFVPCCLIIALVDWRRDKKDKEEIEWHSKDNNTLYLDKDQGQIRHTYTRKRPGTRMDGGASEGRRSAASSAKTNRIYPQL